MGLVFEQQNNVQLRLGYVWAAVYCLVGILLLCTAVSGLVGSAAVRIWHHRLIKGMLLSIVCTVTSIVVLSTWGGFPPNAYTKYSQKIYFLLNY